MSAPRILLIDNYDSFTYNLYQYLCELGASVTVVRNDAIDVEQARALAPDFIVISPGPGVPRDAGVSVELVRALGPSTPTLGVCLGHQAIAEAFGGVITRAPELMHGKASHVYHDGSGVFEGLPSPFLAIRYHSLCAAPEAVPADLEVTARTDTGVIMAVRHRSYPVYGVQFHPESILTEYGKELLRNFLSMGRPEGDSGAHQTATGRSFVATAANRTNLSNAERLGAASESSATAPSPMGTITQ
jgi:anthranilate synthase component 2